MKKKLIIVGVILCVVLAVPAYHVAVKIFSVDNVPLLGDSFLPKTAKHIRYSNRFMGHWYFFNVSLEDFLSWCKEHSWPIEKNEGKGDKWQYKKYEYIYIMRHGNGGGVTVAYDLDTQTAYYSYFDR